MTPRENESVLDATLENGLRVLALPDRSAPVASVQVWYRAGSKNEQVGERGIAHLFEHMMFKGTDTVGPEEHARVINEVGGVVNAFTLEDATAYYDTVPSDRIALPLGLEAERMSRLRITEELLASEKEVVKEEKRHRIDNNPILKTIVDFRAAVFEGNPYAWTPAGTIEDLDAVTVDLCKDFYRRYYAPNNAVLVVVGDFDPDWLMGEVGRTFGGIPAGPPVPPVGFIVPQRTAYEVREVQAPVQVPILIGGYIIPEASHPDIPALEVLATILAHGESSRLHRRLVREEKIAFQAGTSPHSFQRAGLFLVYALFPTDTDRNLLLERLLTETEAPGKTPPTESELRKARAQHTASHVFGLLSAQGRAVQLGEAELIEGDYRRFLEGAQRYDRVTAEDIVRVGSKYLVRSNLSVMIQDPMAVGNGGDEA